MINTRWMRCYSLTKYIRRRACYNTMNKYSKRLKMMLHVVQITSKRHQILVETHILSKGHIAGLIIIVIMLGYCQF